MNLVTLPLMPRTRELCGADQQDTVKIPNAYKDLTCCSISWLVDDVEDIKAYENCLCEGSYREISL